MGVPPVLETRQVLILNAMAHHLWEFLGQWDLQPALIAGVVLSSGAYLWGAREVSRRHRTQPWPARRTALFLGGALVALLATAGPIGAYDDEYFWDHMLQHLALTMVVPPLVILAEPVVLVLRLAPRRTRHRLLVPLLRSRAVSRLTDPVVSWLVLAAVLVGTHVTGFYEYSLEHPVVHEYVEHPLYLTAGMLYFYPLFGKGPGLHRVPPFARVASLFVMMLPATVLGFWLATAKSPVYPWYSTVTDRPLGPSTPLLDQHLGGAIMWGSSMVLNALWISVAVAGWFAAEEIRARRVDAAVRRQLADEG